MPPPSMAPPALEPWAFSAVQPEGAAGNILLRAAAFFCLSWARANSISPMAWLSLPSL